MTPLKTFKCSFPFRNISIPGSEPSVARELRSNSFPHFSFSSAQLHDVWLGGASVLGSHLAGEPSAVRLTRKVAEQHSAHPRSIGFSEHITTIDGFFYLQLLALRAENSGPRVWPHRSSGLSVLAGLECSCWIFGQSFYALQISKGWRFALFTCLPQFRQIMRRRQVGVTIRIAELP